MVAFVDQIVIDPKVHIENELLAPLDLLHLWGSPTMWQFSREGRGQGVVVVHGFLAIDATTNELRRYLKHLGYQVFRSGIGVNATCFNIALPVLIASCEEAVRVTGKRIIGIGHSLGGVLIRAAAVCRPDLFCQVITLGSPINAIRIATQMRAAHSLVAEIHATRGCGYGPDCGCKAVRAFRTDFPESVDHHSVYTRTDGVVSWECCLEEEEERNHLVGSTHSSLVFNSETFGTVRSLMLRTQP